MPVAMGGLVKAMTPEPPIRKVSWPSKASVMVQCTVDEAGNLCWECAKDAPVLEGFVRARSRRTGSAISMDLTAKPGIALDAGWYPMDVEFEALVAGVPMTLRATTHIESSEELQTGAVRTLYLRP